MGQPRSTVTLGAVALLFLAAACGSNSGSGGHGCSRPCFAWQYCDTNQGACVPSACSTDADCGARSIHCNAHVCEPTQCLFDAECDDGVFCNGAEVCGPPSADAPNGCKPGARPCTAGQTCDEARNVCVNDCVDGDGDGHLATPCGGDDCDDSDPNVHPGVMEVCDSANKDEDCDPSTFGHHDGDGDGYDSNACCNALPGGGMNCGLDCNDSRAGVHPGVPEVCNHVDDDCDGSIDQGVAVPAYIDADHDGAGAPGTPVNVCPQDLGEGYAVYANDCDDKNAAIGPGSFRCVSSQTIGTIEICLNNGTWMSTNCGQQRQCVAQPNGTGVCF
jgi:hypothetical protein